MLDLSVIILTYNEELHIERCINSVREVASDIFLVDSFSTDRTVPLAESLGAKVFQNPWENNHARQFNWGLDHLPIQTEWVLRLDADEYLSEELIREIKEKLPLLNKSVTGVLLRRKQFCFGKWFHPLQLLRIFRQGTGRCEERWMDEHIVLSEGAATTFNHLFYDQNLNSFGWWIEKHNRYSIREAIDLLNVEYHLFESTENAGMLHAEAQKKRDRKLRYVRLPLFGRSFAYFIYRYVFRLGFMQGKAGFVWHFFQGWWYRTLVDAKIWEIKRACGNDREKMFQYIWETYRIDFRK